jgi:hypothetical protein
MKVAWTWGAMALTGCLAMETAPDPGWAACQEDLESERCPESVRLGLCGAIVEKGGAPIGRVTAERCAAYLRGDSGAVEDAGVEDASGSEGDASVEDAAAPECSTDAECPVDRPVCALSGACTRCGAKAACSERVETPVCDVETGACVPCGEGDEGACEAEGTVCRSGGHDCVACNVGGDCSSDAAARCEANECVRCVSDTDCRGRANAVCSDGQCVECTAEKASACDGFVCAAQACTTLLPASADLCAPCVADAQCGLGGVAALCIGTRVGDTDAGSYCLPTLAAGESCVGNHRPFAAAALDAQGQPSVSIDGASAAACALRATSCQALANYQAAVSCGGASDDARCGVEGLDDGRCRLVAGQGVYQCTIPCVTASDCVNGATCTIQGVCSF